MCGTEKGYAAMRCAARRPRQRRRSGSERCKNCAMSGTDIACGGMRCPVLTQRMVPCNITGIAYGAMPQYAHSVWIYAMSGTVIA
eukprot:3103231-Rhodomonas_salina.4